MISRYVAVSHVLAADESSITAAADHVDQATAATQTLSDLADKRSALESQAQLAQAQIEGLLQERQDQLASANAQVRQLVAAAQAKAAADAAAAAAATLGTDPFPPTVLPPGTPATVVAAIAAARTELGDAYQWGRPARPPGTARASPSSRTGRPASPCPAYLARAVVLRQPPGHHRAAARRPAVLGDEPGRPVVDPPRGDVPGRRVHDRGAAHRARRPHRPRLPRRVLRGHPGRPDREHVGDLGRERPPAVGCCPVRTLADRYSLEDCVLDGPHWSYWRGHDGILRRAVGILVVEPDDELEADVLSAARDSSAAEDPRLLRVLDVLTDDEGTALVIEWLSAETLEDLLADGPLPDLEAWRLTLDVAQALAAAQVHGLGHGALAPHWVLRGEDGRIRLLGLCIAAVLCGVTSPGRTRTAPRVDPGSARRA